MKFRRKLLLLFALTITACISSVAVLISYFARRNFEDLSKRRSSTLVLGFEHELAQRSRSIQFRVDAIAASQTAVRMAIALNRDAVDYGEYLNEAKNLADAQQLNFLDFLDEQGTILASAEWPAKFGYKASLPATQGEGVSFQREDLPDGPTVGISAMRKVTIGSKPLFVIGGQRIDRSFIASLDVPSGMHALLYENLGPEAGPPRVIDAVGRTLPTSSVAALIKQVEANPRENSAIVHWSVNSEDDAMVYVTPLLGADRQLLGAILFADSLRPYLDLRRQIRYTTVLIGTAGILLAVLLSGWAATRVTKPVEQLASAAQAVAAGEWSTRVDVDSKDELAYLAQSFNRMTGELLQQKERLVQVERVAAWRELARRLAHELKNPLFPLQLTVENLIRARQQSREEFDEVFSESASTLLTEIANFKSIVARFSEFSKMPQPQFQRVQINDVVQDSVRTFQTQLTAASIHPQLELSEALNEIAADPELLHRAFSNLISNAIDAMPNGGILTIRTTQGGESVCVKLSDTGIGLTVEERERLFTPYFTTKQHGTGLGLAIVQSIVSDHGGRIWVESARGSGTTFSVELPRNIDKLQQAEQADKLSVTS